MRPEKIKRKCTGQALPVRPVLLVLFLLFLLPVFSFLLAFFARGRIGGVKHPYSWDKLSSQSVWKYYEDENYRSRIGIDVSQWQGTIDWQTLAEQTPVEFAIIKLGYRGSSEGALVEDPCFTGNLSGARQNGMDVGVYFFSQAITEEEAVEEAEYVLSLLAREGITSQSIPVAYDLEFNEYSTDTRIDGVSDSQFQRNAIAFCNRIRQGGFEAMIYTNRSWEYQHWDMSELENYQIWYSEPADHPSTRYNMTFWQYGAEEIPGCGGKCDLNLQFVLKEEAAGVSE